MFENSDEYVEGEMNIPNSQKTNKIGEPEFNTLDEPIRDTVVSILHCYQLCYILMLLLF